MSGQKYSFKEKSFQLILFYYYFNGARIKLKRESCISCALEKRTKKKKKEKKPFFFATVFHP